MLMLQVHWYPALTRGNPTSNTPRKKDMGSFYFAAFTTEMLGNLGGKKNGNRSREDSLRQPQGIFSVPVSCLDSQLFNNVVEPTVPFFPLAGVLITVSSI